MTDPTTPTFATSLSLLTEAVGKASEDLRSVQAILQRATAEIAAPSAATERAVVTAATRAIDHLRETDEALRDVVRAIESRG